MLFGSEHPAQTDRRRARAPHEASNRLSVLIVDRRVATKLWHTRCVVELPREAVGASAVWGHGGGSNWGTCDQYVPLSRRDVSAANLFVVP